MTQSIGIVERMRWMVAAGAAAILALVAAVAVSGRPLQLPSLGSSPAAGASSSTAAAGSSSTLDPRIASLAAHNAGSRIQAIVQFKSTIPLAQARVEAERAGGQVFATVDLIHALGVKLTAGQARSLAGKPNVHAVSLNATVAPQWASPVKGRFHGSLNLANDLQSTFNQTLGTLPLWSAGLTGSGVGVAVIDTGIDGNLPDFANASGNSRVIATAVTDPAAHTVYDTYGHGTDVAGIIAGNSDNRSSSDPLRGKYMGVAPNANLISVKVSDDNGNATVLDVIEGLQFVVTHQSQYNIRVVNMSLSSATPQSYKTDPLDAAVEAAWMRGVVVVVAAGNRGAAAGAVQYAPGNDPYAIAVGAVDENGTSNPLNDAIASWSSRGTTQDGFQKPDVYAPGAHIVSLLAPNSYFSKACPSCVVDGQYITTSGTSMAAPMISGLVADLLQGHPSLTPDQIKGALTSSSVSSNPKFQEPDAVKAGLDANPQAADQGLTPNKLLGPGGAVQLARSSWSQSSWSMATGALKAPFAQASWSCAGCTGNGGVDPSMSSWGMSSWGSLPLN